eukprot:3783264-Lingulodinium_polyedra.AAC.1
MLPSSRDQIRRTRARRSSARRARRARLAQLARPSTSLGCRQTPRVPYVTPRITRSLGRRRRWMRAMQNRQPRRPAPLPLPLRPG